MVYGQYTGEPWCLRPWEIARLTDWQLEYVFRRPAARADRVARGLSPELPEDGPGDSMPREKEAFVRWWQRVNGGDRESAIRKYHEEFGDGE